MRRPEERKAGRESGGAAWLGTGERNQTGKSHWYVTNNDKHHFSFGLTVMILARVRVVRGRCSRGKQTMNATAAAVERVARVLVFSFFEGFHSRFFTIMVIVKGFSQRNGTFYSGNSTHRSLIFTMTTPQAHFGSITITTRSPCLSRSGVLEPLYVSYFTSFDS